MFLALVLLVVIIVVVLWGLKNQGDMMPGTSPTSIQVMAPAPSTPALKVTDVSESPILLKNPLAFVWVVLGGLLALGITVFILRRYRQSV
jgi:hypothetical protein